MAVLRQRNPIFLDGPNIEDVMKAGVYKQPLIRGSRETTIVPSDGHSRKYT